MECYGNLVCSIAVESSNPRGAVHKRREFHKSDLKLGRDQMGEVVLKAPGQTFILKDFSVLSKFIKTGKATIILKKLNTNIMISNAPPDQLLIFMKMLKVKTTIQKTPASDRTRLYSMAKSSFDEISPLTLQDVKTFKTKTQSITSPLAASKSNKPNLSDITPIRATKRGLAVEKNNPRKRLNSNTTSAALKKLGVDHMSSTPMLKKSKPISHSTPAVVAMPLSEKPVKLSMRLTKEQTNVLRAVKQGFNVFFTGSAGTGKSFLLKRIIGALPPDCTVASASTGVAACQIGGITLHSFAGIGSGEASLERCIELASRPSVTRNWKRCKTLIVDEISMVDAEFFDKLEKIARVIRNSELPFGGVQLIVCGDFLQLPPVNQNNKENIFCFQAKSWEDTIQVSLELTEVKRQKDEDFVNLLQYIRVGKCPEQVYERLMATQHNKIEANGIQATRLCTHKNSAEEINLQKMKELKSEERLFTSSDSDRQYSGQMDKQLPVREILTLKAGAQVMLSKNLDVSKGLVNGARGYIVKFLSDKQGLPLVRFAQGTELVVKRERFVYKTPSGAVTRSQLPLQLAWAISIHKSQGLTLDCCEVSLERVFENGQAYVALSRAKSLQGLRVVGMTRTCVRAHRDVLRFYIKLRRQIKMTGQDEGSKENDIIELE